MDHKICFEASISSLTSVNGHKLNLDNCPNRHMFCLESLRGLSYFINYRVVDVGGSAFWSHHCSLHATDGLSAHHRLKYFYNWTFEFIVPGGLTECGDCTTFRLMFVAMSETSRMNFNDIWDRHSLLEQRCMKLFLLIMLISSSHHHHQDPDCQLLMAVYDENILTNPFYLALEKQRPDLCSRVAELHGIVSPSWYLPSVEFHCLGSI